MARRVPKTQHERCSFLPVSAARAMKVIVEPHHLQKGMYVSELDRPWLDTPFLFQGFRITNQDEIEQIRSLCDFVFVDVTKSTVPVSDPVPDTALPEHRPERQSYAKMIRMPSPYTATFEDEVVRAWQCYQDATEQLRAVFDDIKMGKSLHLEGARAAVTAMTHSILRQPDALVLLASLGNKDKSLVTHALSVCTLSLAFARFLGLERGAFADIGMAALLHDVGELKLPDSVLCNAVNGSEEEQALLQQHTAIGAVMLKKLDGLPENVIAIVHDHHERADGSGYPRRLTGAEIGLHTKVVSIADTYDSITNGLHGYHGMKVEDALRCIYTWRRNLFDEILVEKFIQCIGIYPLGSVVELRTGQVGIVVSSRPDARLFPTLLLVLDAQKDAVEPPQLINLALFREKLGTNDFEVTRLVDAAQYNIDVRQYILRELPLG